MSPDRPRFPSAACVLAAWCVLHVTPAVAAPAYVPGEVLVKYRVGVPASTRARVATALPGLQSVRAFDFVRAQHLVFDGLTTEEALARLRSDPAVELAEPNWVITADVLPNDSLFSQQWALRNTGQGGAFAGDDIDAALAWDRTTGDPELKIGVIDTGIDWTHPDLAPNVWTNPGEIPGNGVDDDGNGYVDDVHGYDVLNGDGDPMDDGSHGTHVAGTIGAATGNGIGIAGVAWRCRLVGIKFMDALGVGDEAHALAAIEYAIAARVRLTNNSWGNMPGGQLLLDAIDAAGRAGQLFVTAAGNNHWNIDAVPVYPACYPSPYIVTVMATDGRDLVPQFSNIGANSIHLGAPGLNVLSCQPGARYQLLSGTSMAAPHVTGVAALAFGLFPHATVQQIRQLILANTEPVASLAGKCQTGGRLNAYRVLANGDATPPSGVADLAAADTGPGSLRLTWTAPGDDGAIGTATRYLLRMSTSPLDSASFDAAAPETLAAPLAAGSAETLDRTGLTTGTTYWFALRAVDDFGNVGPLSNVAMAMPGVTAAGSPAPLRLALRRFGAHPAHGAVTLMLELPRGGPTVVTVHDVAGARVRTLLAGDVPAGRHALRWDAGGDAGAPVPPGVYFVRARAARATTTARVVLSR